MASPIAHGDAQSTAGSDVVSTNTSQDAECSRTDDNIPPRPSSRLGFSQSAGDSDVASAMPDSEFAQRPHSLLQSIGFAELSLPPANITDVMESAPLLPPSVEKPSVTRNMGTVPFPSTQQKGVERPSEPTECRSNAKAPAVPRKTPTPVSRLCFPFVTSSPRRKKPPPPLPPPRHKHSCFPTLLSPTPAGRPSPTHQRHSYRQHGYSHLALQHTKCFWEKREEEWDGQKSGEGTAHAGIAPERVVSVNLTARPPSPTPVRSLESSAAPLTIHPRRGDIAALRDPYCVQIDHCFVGLQTWTIGKTIWMHDLHLATEKRRARLQVMLDDDVSDVESETEMDASMSTGFSDDSDATLVESESDSDLPLMAMRSTSSVFNQTQTKLIASPSTTPVVTPLPSALPSPSIDRLALEKVTWSVPFKASGYSSDKPLWATNWYHRWEVLVELAQRAQNRTPVRFELVAPPSKFGNSSIKRVPRPESDNRAEYFHQ